MKDLERTTDNAPKWGVFGDDFDNLFEGFLRPMSRFGGAETGTLMPPVDVIDEENQYVVTAELPGINRKDINVTVNDGVLTINAERKAETEDKDEKGRVIRRESRYGNYVRSMRLDNTVDVKNLKANYKDGILRLVVPKSEAAKPQKIEVKVS